MLSPVFVPGKIMFQDATRLKIGWDDPIPGELSVKWCHWVNDLVKIKSLTIPRSVKQMNLMHIEIHNFSDAIYTLMDARERLFNDK